MTLLQWSQEINSFPMNALDGSKQWRYGQNRPMGVNGKVNVLLQVV
jgi:hypothetical protein